MLQFFNISMLFGVLGASIPLLIHLFSRRKRKIIVFSSLRFLQALEPKTLKWLRLKQRWLLILRALILAFVALALARPVWRPETEPTGGPGPHRVAVITDASFSMRAGQRWETLKAQADVLQAQLSPKDAFQGFWLGSDLAPCASPAQWRGALEKTTPQWQHSALLSTLMKARDWLQEDPDGQSELLIFSDFQAPAWTALSDSVFSPFEDAVFTVRCGKSQDNLAVTGLELATQVYDSGKLLKLNVHVANLSDQAVHGRLIRLFVNGNAVAQQQIDLAPDAAQRLVFNVLPDAVSSMAISAALENDAFPGDDSRHLVLPLPGLLRTLVVSGAHDSAAPLYRALRAGGESKHSRVAGVAQTAAWLPLLPEHDVAVLHNISLLQDHEVAAVQRFVRQGGGALFIPGSRVDLRAWQRDFFKPLLNMDGAHIAGDGHAGSLLLARPPQREAFWKGLFNSAQGPFTSPEIRKLITLQPAEASVFLRTSDGRPWLVGAEVGMGRVLVMASGLEADWSSLPQTGFFAALMHRASIYLGSVALTPDRALTPGQPLVFHLPYQPDAAGLHVVTPEQERLYPTVALQNGVWTAEAGRAGHPGMYRLMDSDSTLAVVAVNGDAGESDLRTVSRPTLAGKFPRAKHYDVDNGPAFAQALKESRSGSPLWPFLWFLIGLLVAAEMLVSRQRRHERQTEAG